MVIGNSKQTLYLLLTEEISPTANIRQNIFDAFLILVNAFKVMKQMNLYHFLIAVKLFSILDKSRYHIFTCVTHKSRFYRFLVDYVKDGLYSTPIQIRLQCNHRKSSHLCYRTTVVRYK